MTDLPSDQQPPFEGSSPGDDHASPGEPLPDDPVGKATHRLRNELYGILLQAHCAQSQWQDGQTADIEQRLAQIEASARDSREMLDHLLAIITK